MADSSSHRPVVKPPRWADRFLSWYCRPDLLEEIQGDVYELFYRKAVEQKRLAKIQFAWNVIRFFRIKNIRKIRRPESDFNLTIGMIKNILKVALRNFFRQPGHSFLNVLGLTVSFFAAFLILLWVLHETSYDRFHRQPDQIYKVLSHVETNGTYETYDAAEAQMNVSSVPEITDKVIVINGTRWPNELCFRPEGKTTDCIYMNGIYSDESFFKVFQFPILQGDTNPLRDPASLAISEEMASRLYGSENPIGRIIKIDDYYPVTVASIFKKFPTNSTIQADFVLPLALFKKMRGLDEAQFGVDFLPTYVRTQSAVSADVLTQKLQSPLVLTERLKNDHVSYTAYPLTSWRLHSEFENAKPVGGRIQYVNLFLIIASLVVLMAVINFINLSTARASSRSKEIGIRKVTGAFRSSIVVQFIGESFLVVLIAVALAVLLTQLSLPLFHEVLGETLTVQLLTPQMGLYLLIFLVGISIVAGIYPALVMSSFQPARVLKGELTTRTTGAPQLRKVLLIVQVTVSVSIIIFTGILFQQLSFIQKKNLGFDRENILGIEPTYKLLKQYDAFKNELMSLAQVKGVTASNANPLTLGGHTTGVVWPGMPENARPTFQLLGCNYEFPETFGIQLLEGRSFAPTALDTLHSEVLVTEEAVKVMGLTNPIGTIFKIGDAECVIIGVLRDFHTESLRSNKLPVVLYTHPILNCSRLFVKYEPGTTAEALEAIQAVYRKYEPSFTMKYTFQDDVFNNMYKTEKTASFMIIFFAIISLIIAVIGVVGLATYHVLRRKKEIGIKRVFGASVSSILVMFAKEFSLLVGIAAVIAIPFAYYGADQWLSGFAYRIDMPWLIFAGTIAGIILFTIALICVQTIKTARTNPTQVLRND